jgi:hypothetical protein
MVFNQVPVNDAEGSTKSRAVCPFCSQPIHDFEQIQLDVLRATTFSEVMRAYLHSATKQLDAAAVSLSRLKQNRLFRQSKDSVEAIECASWQLDELHSDFDSIFDYFRSESRDDRPLTEVELQQIHLSLDALFRFRCKTQMQGLQSRRLQVGVSVYRQFVRLILQLALFAVGRQAKPQILVQYQGGTSSILCEVCLRNGAGLELDEMQLNLVFIMAHRIGIPFQSEIHGKDRVFHWNIPVKAGT